MSSIVELLERDPLSLTKGNVEEIVQWYRDSREKFVQGVKTPKPKAEPKPKGKVDIDSLDLDIEL